MLLSRRKLKLGSKYWGTYIDKRGDDYFCDACLYGCFDGVPASAERIELVLHDRPHDDRLELKFKKRRWIIVVDVDGEFKPTFDAFDVWLQTHMPESGVCWLEVWYWI